MPEGDTTTAPAPATPPPTLEATPPPATPPARTRKRSSASSASSNGNASSGKRGGSSSSASSASSNGNKPEGDKPESHKPTHNALNPVASAADSVSGWPVPGGLALLLAFIVILLFIVVPVNGGMSRAQLIWQTLRGKVRTPGVVTQADQNAAASSSAPATSSASDLAAAAASAAGNLYQSAANAVSGQLGPASQYLPGVGGAGMPPLASGGDLGGATDSELFGVSGFGSNDYGALDLDSIMS